jgi:hypothetical protein
MIRKSGYRFSEKIMLKQDARGPLEENHMPNRGELARAKPRSSTAAAAVPADAWPIVGFCALGFLMSIFAASSGGIELIHRIF